MQQEARRETKFRKLLPRIVDDQPTSHRGVSARLRGPYGPLLMLKYRMPKQQQEVKGAALAQRKGVFGANKIRIASTMSPIWFRFAQTAESRPPNCDRSRASAPRIIV